MRRLLAWLGVAVLAVPVAVAAERPQDAEDEYVAILGTRVSLRRPPGFVRTRGETGLSSVSGDIAIVVWELLQPFDDLQREHTKEELGRYGILLLGREELEIDGHNGFIAYALQRAGGNEIALWIAGFGTEQQSVLLHARAPKGQAKQVSDMFHETLVTARWALELPYDPFSGLPFVLAGKHRLKLARRVSDRITYTRTGSLDGAPGDPVLVVSHTPTSIPEDRRDELCRGALETATGVSEISIQGSEALKVDGLEGCEVVAFATRDSGDGRLALYQAVLFERKGYYVFHGRVGSGLQYRFLSAFKEVVVSFKRR
jgi:hypothetical protein